MDWKRPIEGEVLREAYANAVYIGTYVNPSMLLLYKLKPERDLMLQITRLRLVVAEESATEIVPQFTPMVTDVQTIALSDAADRKGLAKLGAATVEIAGNANGLHLLFL